MQTIDQADGQAATSTETTSTPTTSAAGDPPRERTLRCGHRRARRPGWVPVRVARRAAVRVRSGVHDAGMATAEYAIATLAAVGFAGLLVVILKGNEVKSLLSGIVKQALSL